MSLIPCPACSRHVRATETACPFCATSLVSASLLSTAVSPPIIGERLGRAALFAFGAAMATNAIGCGTAVAPEDAAQVAPADGGTDAPANPDSGFFPPYGTPPVDGGHDSGLAAAYGAPPHDANVAEDGGNAALYGAPPVPPPPPEQP